MAPRILIFSITIGASYLFYVKSIATYAPAFLVYNISVLARVYNERPFFLEKDSFHSDISLQKGALLDFV